MRATKQAHSPECETDVAKEANSRAGTQDSEEHRITLHGEGLDSLLPLGLIRSPQPPTDFPARSNRPLPETPPQDLVNDRLQDVHAHERDRHLSFDPATHSYSWKGRRVRESVTQLLHRFTEDFDEDQTIQKMSAGQRWPRPGYVKGTISTNLAQQIAQLPAGAQILALLQPEQRREEELCQLLRAALQRATPTQAAVLRDIAESPDEIKSKWSRARCEAARQGTWMHAQFECLLNGGSVADLTPEIRLLLIFLQTLRESTVYRTEWKIYAESIDVAGSIDVAFQQPDGAKILVDWKRSSRIASREEHFNRFMKPPLAHVGDSSIWRYRMQLNVYRWILQQHYDQVVVAMYIVGTHPDNGSEPWVDEVPMLDDETKSLMQAAAPRTDAKSRAFEDKKTRRAWPSRTKRQKYISAPTRAKLKPVTVLLNIQVCPHDKSTQM